MDELETAAFDIRMAPEAKVKLGLISLVLGGVVSIATYLITTRISQTTIEAANTLFEDVFETQSEG